jgi:hypothetical protein
MKEKIILALMHLYTWILVKYTSMTPFERRRVIFFGLLLILIFDHVIITVFVCELQNLRAQHSTGQFRIHVFLTKLQSKEPFE